MSEKIEQEDKNLFTIYSVKCVSCIHLYPTHPEAKSHNSCHYIRGNSLCPAQEINIVVGIDKPAVIKNLIKSFEEDDIQAAIEQMNKLIRKPEKERVKILSEVLNREIKPKKKKSKKD